MGLMTDYTLIIKPVDKKGGVFIGTMNGAKRKQF